LKATVARCDGCGVERLAESACIAASDYEAGQYRRNLDQNHDLEDYHRQHDHLVRHTLEAFGPRSLRGKVVADVGCGGGSLLDHVRGVAGEIIAIEPDAAFGSALQSRGYRWFPNSREASARHFGRVDVAFAVQVIEHVEDPRRFLQEIASLLSPDGVAFVSTPNRNDILMSLLPETFPFQFYRQHHRWAFDGDSLVKTAAAAGLDCLELRFTHRYGLGNAMRWLCDGRGQGDTALPPLNAGIDAMWKTWLESEGRADNLSVLLRRASDKGSA
jgi:SAM-dependent methyltransferase